MSLIPSIFAPGAIQVGPRVSRQDVWSSLGFVDLRARGLAGGGVNNGDVFSGLVPGQQYLVPAGTWFLGDDVTVPDSVGLWFAQGAQLDIDPGVELTHQGALTTARNNHIFGGSGGVVLPNEGDIYAPWFGAIGDADAAKAAANSTAFNRAIVTAQASRNANVVSGPGIFTLNDTADISSPGNGGVTIIGHRDQALQQGSAYPSAVFRWVGGAAPMFRANETYCSFYHFAVENWGTATDVLEVTSDGAGRIHMYRVCATVAGLSVPFSRAFVTTGYSNYDRYERCEIVGCCPIFLNMDAGGATHGTTTIQIEKCIFDSVVTQQATGFRIVKLTNVNVESLQIFGNTFNNQANGGGLYVLDCTDIGAGSLIDFVYRDNEYDGDVSMPTATKIAILKNCQNAIVEGSNTAYGGGGQMKSLFTLENSHLSIAGINANSVDGWLVDPLDAASTVDVGPCDLNTNTRGVVNQGARTSAWIDVVIVAGTSARLMPQKSSSRSTRVHRVTIPNGVGVTLQQPDYTGAAPDGWAWPVPGQTLRIEVMNTHSGPIVFGFDAAAFKMAAWTSPAAGFRKFVDITWDGAYWVQSSIASPDIPN